MRHLPLVVSLFIASTASAASIKLEGSLPKNFSIEATSAFMPEVEPMDLRRSDRKECFYYTMGDMGGGTYGRGWQPKSQIHKAANTSTVESKFSLLINLDMEKGKCQWNRVSASLKIQDANSSYQFNSIDMDIFDPRNPDHLAVDLSKTKIVCYSSSLTCKVEPSHTVNGTRTILIPNDLSRINYLAVETRE